MKKQISPGTCRGVRRRERLIEGFRVWHKRRYKAFTLIELVVVFGLILVLSGLVLSTAGYARKKGARARAENEIAAMSAASESYKADNGVYPANAATNSLNARINGNPSSTPCPSPCPDPIGVTAYSETSFYLYTQLSGDTNANFQPPPGTRTYFTFKPQMLEGPRDANGNLTGVSYIKDPFGYSYGYSTAFQHDLDQGVPPTHGYNPTFDLWSTTGTTSGSAADRTQWITNW